jgi:hypothetical protein
MAKSDGSHAVLGLNRKNAHGSKHPEKVLLRNGALTSPERVRKRRANETGCQNRSPVLKSNNGRISPVCEQLAMKT